MRSPHIARATAFFELEISQSCSTMRWGWSSPCELWQDIKAQLELEGALAWDYQLSKCLPRVRCGDKAVCTQ